MAERSDRALVLFDDDEATAWRPFTLTRPAGELLFGAFTLRGRAERALGATCIGHQRNGAAPHLDRFDEPDAPSVLDPAGPPRDRDRIFLSSRAVPDVVDPPVFDGPALLACGDRACGWFAPAGAPPPPQPFLRDPAGFADDADLPVRSVRGTLLDHVWELVTRNADRIGRDVAALFPDSPAPGPAAGVHRIGDAPLILGADVAIEPGVVIDLREGPVWLDDGVTVRAFSRVAGPVYVGPGSTLLGGSFTAVSIGPVCKVHGEIEETVVLGYANKAHDGYIGHAYLGRWVNLGAMTTNSDLKNNYGPVRIWTPRGIADSGETKLGCLLGDHVKTAIGTLLNTGSVIGAGSNLFGASAPPTYVPPFSWGTGEGSVAYDLERFLGTAETVMARRDVTLTQDQRALLTAAWHLVRDEG